MPPISRSNYDVAFTPQRANTAQFEDDYGDHPATKWEKAGLPGREPIAALGGHAWPTGLHRVLSEIAGATGETLVHYFCESSGGPPDFESSVVVSPDVPVVMIDHEEGKRDPLVEALVYLDLVLPTGFFAPHERSFDWSRYALDPA